MDKKAELNDLMIKSQKGDNEAYRKLLNHCSKLAAKYVYSRINDKSNIDDVIQEILVSIHKSKHTFNPEKEFLPWFYAISNFRLNDYLKKIYSNKEINNFDEVFSNFLFEETKYDEVEKQQLIKKALEILNDKQKQIVELLYLEGFSAKEVSNKMKISVSDVKVSAHRALNEIKIVYGKNNG